MNNQYKTGLLIGKFQGIHNGSYKVIQTALSMCDEVVLLVTTPNQNQNNTFDFDYLDKYPFKFEFIERMLTSCFSYQVATGKLIIREIQDNREHDVWSVSVFDTFKRLTNQISPSCLFYGKDNVYAKREWFSKEYLSNTHEIAFSRDNDMNATNLRKLIQSDLFADFKSMSPQKSHRFFNEMQKELKNN